MSRRQTGTPAVLAPPPGRAGGPGARERNPGRGVRRLWDEGKGHTGDGSAWEGFQAAVEFIDHDPLAVRGADTAERRALGLYDGAPGKVKQRIARNLFAFAAANEVEEEALVFGE